jgi:hypothetical protein
LKVEASFNLVPIILHNKGLLFKFCDIKSFAKFSQKIAKLVKFTLGKQKLPQKRSKLFSLKNVKKHLFKRKE